MTKPPVCLILACGNPLRGDDGIGPHLAEWAAEHFASHNRVQVICQQQWTPELARAIADAGAVLFLDCSIASNPGVVQLTQVRTVTCNGSGTHHFDAAALLGLAHDLYGRTPDHAIQLTIGASSTELGQELSSTVQSALPGARAFLQTAVRHLLYSTAIARSVPA